MVNNKQIQLIQIAARQAGLRGKGFRQRYDLLLGQYRQGNGKPVTSCKQLNRSQIEDFLAICEGMGFRGLNKPDDYYRSKVVKSASIASYAQQRAIDYLAGDLGWDLKHLENFIKRMTGGRTIEVAALTPKEAWGIIEALKAILSKETGTQYTYLNEIKEDFSEVVTDGKKNQAG